MNIYRSALLYIKENLPKYGNIGRCRFLSDIDNNDYNHSDVKKEIDDWYQANLEYGGK